MRESTRSVCSTFVSAPSENRLRESRQKQLPESEDKSLKTNFNLFRTKGSQHSFLLTRNFHEVGVLSLYTTV